MNAQIKNMMIGDALWSIFAQDFRAIVKEEALLAESIFEATFRTETEKNLFELCPEEWFRPASYIYGILHPYVEKTNSIFGPSFRPDISFLSGSERKELMVRGYTFDDILGDTPEQRRITHKQPNLDRETSVRAIKLREDIFSVRERYNKVRLEMLKIASSTRSISKLEKALGQAA